MKQLSPLHPQMIPSTMSLRSTLITAVMNRAVTIRSATYLNGKLRDQMQRHRALIFVLELQLPRRLSWLPVNLNSSRGIMSIVQQKIPLLRNGKWVIIPHMLSALRDVGVSTQDLPRVTMKANHLAAIIATDHAVISPGNRAIPYMGLLERLPDAMKMFKTASGKHKEICAVCWSRGCLETTLARVKPFVLSPSLIYLCVGWFLGFVISIAAPFAMRRSGPVGCREGGVLVTPL